MNNMSFWPQIEFGSLFKEKVLNGYYSGNDSGNVEVKIVKMGEIFDNDFIGPQTMSTYFVNDEIVSKYSLK